MQWDEDIFEKLPELLMVFVSVLGDFRIFLLLRSPRYCCEEEGEAFAAKVPHRDATKWHKCHETIKSQV